MSTINRSEKLEINTQFSQQNKKIFSVQQDKLGLQLTASNCHPLNKMSSSVTPGSDVSSERINTYSSDASSTNIIKEESTDLEQHVSSNNQVSLGMCKNNT